MSNIVAKFLETKGYNVRVNIYLIKDESDNHSVIVETRRLHDLKARKISESKTIYSIETFAVLTEMFHYVKDSSYWRKHLHMLEPKHQFQAKTNIEP
jgi:hypothetical protein